MDLPSKEKTFEFEHIGETTGKKYDGRFTVLCLLNVGQKHALGLEKTRLLGGYPNPTDDLITFAIILSNLRAKIIYAEAPEWWKQSHGGAVIEDEDVLVELYNRVQEAEQEWRDKLKEKAQPDPDNQ